jgi:hypothetical protein
MENVFICLLFGHLFGDYFFQNDWMAQNKKKKTFDGIIACITHCSVYTFIVAAFLMAFGVIISPLQIVLIFLSHYILDRYNLIDTWCDINGIITWKSEIKEKSDNIDFERNASIKDSINISFGTFVNIVQDNTLHLLLMWLILILL